MPEMGFRRSCSRYAEVRLKVLYEFPFGGAVSDAVESEHPLTRLPAFLQREKKSPVGPLLPSPQGSEKGRGPVPLHNPVRRIHIAAVTALVMVLPLLPGTGDHAEGQIVVLDPQRGPYRSLGHAHIHEHDHSVIIVGISVQCDGTLAVIGKALRRAPLLPGACQRRQQQGSQNCYYRNYDK